MNTPYLAEISIRSLFRLYAVKLEHSATANQLSRTCAVQSRYRLGVSNPMMDTLRETHEPSSSSNLQVPSIELLDLSLGLITSVNSHTDCSNGYLFNRRLLRRCKTRCARTTSRRTGLGWRHSSDTRCKLTGRRSVRHDATFLATTTDEDTLRTLRNLVRYVSKVR